MPATSSSPIPAALAPLTHAQPLRDTEAPHLLAYLARVPDPRSARGRRHRLVTILALAAAAVLAGAQSIAAIAEWAADTPQQVRVALGARQQAPGCFAVPAEATIRRTLARLDADALAGVIGTWLADRQHPAPTVSRRRAVAVDGKTLRGAHTLDGDGRPVHLLAAMDHQSRAVLAQRQVARRARGSPRLRSAACAAGPGRGGGHRRRAPNPRRGRRVPGHRQAGALPVRRQGQPAHPPGALRPPALASRAGRRPHP